MRDAYLGCVFPWHDACGGGQEPRGHKGVPIIVLRIVGAWMGLGQHGSNHVEATTQVVLKCELVVPHLATLATMNHLGDRSQAIMIYGSSCIVGAVL